MSNDKYLMSFTVGGLFHRESLLLSSQFFELGDWDIVRKRVTAENLLQARTVSALKRSCREAVFRLRTLTEKELEFLVEGSHQEQGYLLWIAICRRYKFVAEFAVEVLRESFLTLKNDLTYEDFDSFFNRKSEWHLELEKITPATRGKLRQVLFRMLREADLLTAGNMIQAAMLSPGLLELIYQANRGEVLYFPVFESELTEVKR
ncbi:DUF1819 family protein [Parahaliea aestuarii]|uniref:DUF1819 family protein n=1 Tax=Parahaliea aestuarii TaxID=1852021 RepID=A0A5C9A1K9_9GAMM|nr:DUF1819 family protein [Parahaliea aestuarii]TXS94755.1 DUF1819 family protein [Parahaliea aestuarii]